MTSFHPNGKTVQVDVDPSTPLLEVLRDSLGMTGTKFGCGMALRRAGTVHLEGMGGNICRCGQYTRIRKVIHRAAQLSAERRTK
ncbi:MAG: hypothetical protein WCE61_02095 [Candidatus Acidiferrum sp.]